MFQDFKAAKVYRGQPDVGPLDVEKRGPRDVSHGAPHLLPGMDHVHSEGIDSIAANVVAVDPRDEDLALVVVDEEAANHPGETPTKRRKL